MLPFSIDLKPGLPVSEQILFAVQAIGRRFGPDAARR